MNVKLVTSPVEQAVYVELLYPTLYKFSCPLQIYYFPYDSQSCKMTFGSWTYDNEGIDYVPHAEKVATSNFLSNDGWSMEGFEGFRFWTRVLTLIQLEGISFKDEEFLGSGIDKIEF